MEKKKEKSETLILDLPEIDYSSTEDRAVLRWKYMWKAILLYFYGKTGHPCAYLKVHQIPADIEMLDVPCNWWITFTKEVEKDEERAKWRFDEWLRIGWDYAHWGDYFGYFINDEILGKGNDKAKKWTTDEIIQECLDAI